MDELPVEYWRKMAERLCSGNRLCFYLRNAFGNGRFNGIFWLRYGAAIYRRKTVDLGGRKTVEVDRKRTFAKNFLFRNRNFRCADSLLGGMLCERTLAGGNGNLFFIDTDSFGFCIALCGGHQEWKVKIQFDIEKFVLNGD